VAKKNKIDFNDIVSSTTKGSKKDEALQQLAQAHDTEFALAMTDIWFFAKHIKTFDEENERIRTFPNYQYLQDINEEVDQYRRLVVCKSRRMLLSWLGTLRQLHRAMRAGTKVPGTKDVFAGGIMTVGETEAIHLMDRIRALYESLPAWMQKRNPMNMNNQMEIRFKCGGKIRAFPLKREGPRTFGFTEVFFDEMAFQEAARSVWMGMIPTLGASGIVFAVSTPNGKGNLYADIWFNKDNLYNDIRRYPLDSTGKPFLAHSDNPEHGANWFKQATKGLDSQMISREFYGSFAAYAGQPVWPAFNRTTHVWDVEEAPMDIQEGVPVYIGWDLGYHFPAAIIAQRNTKDQWLFFREIQGYDEDFDDFSNRVLQTCNALYNRKRVLEIHCVPPDAKFRYSNKSKSGAVNDIGQIKITFRTAQQGEPQVRFSPGEVGTRDNEAPRLKVMRALWKLRKDGLPGIMLHPNMELFIEGCMGGYCYPEKGNTEQPEKNESGHVQDAGQAIVAAYDRMVGSALPKQETKRRPRIHLNFQRKA